MKYSSCNAGIVKIISEDVTGASPLQFYAISGRFSFDSLAGNLKWFHGVTKVTHLMIIWPLLGMSVFHK